VSKRILITPLDWGLGHATRCIPIIRLLLGMGHTVLIGGSGSSLALLKEEFPTLNFLELPPYNPKYPKKRNMVLKMASQLPRFLRAIKRENNLVRKWIDVHHVDLIISDNRYGCWSEKVTSVFITHQSNILMQKRFGCLAKWVHRQNESMMEKFDICWIPDYPAEASLAGELISFGKLKYSGQISYIGHLSRFSFRDVDVKKYEILVICSGPEPQRSILEKMLKHQLSNSGRKYLIIRGVIENKSSTPELKNFLTTDELCEVILQSEVVISRSGYSTIMDLGALGSNVVFIPTPGQTEQEYLARRLKEKGIAFFMEQDVFDLGVALREAKKYSGFSVRQSPDCLTPAVNDALRFSVRKTKA
jgi:uncharacterized protein (TIGR00661 family)